jgi:CHAD domain-containing protein
MNLASEPERAATTSIHDRLGDWRQLVDRCARKPTRKRVHALRVITLRVQAELEIDLAELPHASHQAQAILKFNRLGEKLRKALGPVRELDVWLGKLLGLRASLTQAGDYTPPSTRECLRQLERFELRLKEKRRPLEKKLVAAISKRKDSFANAADEVDSLLGGMRTDGGADAAHTILGQFAEIARDFPTFNEQNLHEFRKRIKMVRYLAEIHEGDAACGMIASQMKKLQSAIGEWHDWQDLSHEVRHGRSKNKDAAELLGSIAAESLELALVVCRQITDKLVSQQTGLPDPGRKIPARVDYKLDQTAERKLA